MVAAAGRGVLLISARASELLAALCVMAAGVSVGAHAQDRTTLHFEAAAGVPVQAQVLEEGGVQLRIGSEATQRVDGVSDEEGHARLDHEDVDFDGFQDLVVRASVGQVNEAVAVYRYDRQAGRFTAMEAPPSAHANCEGFWSLSVDASSRSLISTCRGGPMWYTDVYRYHDGQPYLQRAERMAMLDSQALSALLAVELPEQAGPLAVWSSYDPAGRVLEQALGDGLQVPDAAAPLRPVTARVLPARLPLHAAPGDATTRRYLVAGDRVALLDERDGWLQVRFDNPARGAIHGWIEVALP